MDSFAIGDFGPLRGFWDGFGSSESSSLVLDGKRRDLVRAPARAGRKGGGGGDLDARAAMALKSHSEAEKRRRERINAHLTTLRGLVPNSEKLDKAALLAEVIGHVKKLKSYATEISKGCTVPSDFDEVQVETQMIGMNDGTFSIKASLSCEDRPEVIADLRQTLQNFQLKTLSAEISTLSGRVKVVFVLASESSTTELERHLLATSIQQALKSVLDRAVLAQDLLRNSYPSKRRRMSLFESSCS